MGLSQEAPSDEADPKGLLLLQLSVGLTEVCQLPLEPGSVTVAGTEKAEAARLRDCERKSGMGHEIHRGEHDRMLYAQQPGYGIADRHEAAPRAVFGLDSILKPSYHFRKMIRFDDYVLYSRTVRRWSYPIFRPLRRWHAAVALHAPPAS